MTDPALVFVHSPLVGPLTWRAVADECAAAGWRAAVPDLTAATAGPAPYQPRIAEAVAAAADPLRRPVVLVAHSGAGPLLPAVASSLRVPVAALVYVDAGLPYPGRSWFEAAPPELADRLQSLAEDGWLPPWHEWFGAGALAGLLPDQPQRDRFVAELAPLPLGYFQERTATVSWTGRFGYLLLSEAYRGDAGRAADQGAPVREQLRHHLAMLTSPAAVSATLRELLTSVLR